MGCVGVEYVEALDVCVFRLTGTVLPEDVVEASLPAAMRHPASARLWDITEASFDGWTEERLHAVVGGLGPSALNASGSRVALVSTKPGGGRRVCRIVKRLIASHGFPVTVEVFSSRASALSWLGVMHVPVGGVRPERRP